MFSIVGSRSSILYVVGKLTSAMVFCSSPRSWWEETEEIGKKNEETTTTLMKSEI